MAIQSWWCEILTFLLTIQKINQIEIVDQHVGTLRRKTKLTMKLTLATILAFCFIEVSAEVLSLTSANFQSETAGKTVFIKYFAPWVRMRMEEIEFFFAVQLLTGPCSIDSSRLLQFFLSPFFFNVILVWSLQIPGT